MLDPIKQWLAGLDEHTLAFLCLGLAAGVDGTALVYIIEQSPIHSFFYSFQDEPLHAPHLFLLCVISLTDDKKHCISSVEETEAVS